MPTWIVVIICLIAAHQCWIRGRFGPFTMRLWGIGFAMVALLLISEGAFNFVINQATGLIGSGIGTAIIFLLAAMAGVSKMITGQFWPGKK